MLFYVILNVRNNRDADCIKISDLNLKIGLAIVAIEIQWWIFFYRTIFILIECFFKNRNKYD